MNIECYVPLTRVVKQWSDRKKTIYEPLISGYVFVRLSSTIRDKILQVPGVVQFVRYNKQDAELRDWEIEVLRLVELKGYHIVSQNSNVIDIGEAAQINAGPFKGMKGIVQNSSNKSTYNLLIEQMKLTFIVHVPGEIIFPVKNTSTVRSDEKKL